MVASRWILIAAISGTIGILGCARNAEPDPAGGTNTDVEDTDDPGGNADTSTPNTGDSGPKHDICADIGPIFGIGAAIFGDTGTNWVTDASGPPEDVDWTYGYIYASGDPHDDLDGFSWLVNYRMDTAEQVGAEIPTVTFYRMLNVGEDSGYSGTEPQIVQQMLANPDAVRDYLDDFIALLEILDDRQTPVLVHVEPDSWGFMMWAFDGFDGVGGNPDASSVPVSLSGAEHPDLQGQSFSDDAGGLGQALLHLRDQKAPDVRMGWHASNFRVGTKPEVVTSFYSSMGDWDVIVTEPPHMVGAGPGAWDAGETDNAANYTWLSTVSAQTDLPILIWQTYVEDAEPYIGDWPVNKANMASLADNGVAGVLWDPNGNGGNCGYTCPDADSLLGFLGDYSGEPLELPAGHICAP